MPDCRTIARLAIAGLLCLAAWTTASTSEAREAPETATRAGVEFFEKKIRPVLVERCYSCHSTRARKPRGGLLLDSRHSLLQGGNSGAVLVPGDPDRSMLIRAIRYTDPALQMPPKQKLSREQVADFEAWVREGAPDPRGPGEETRPAQDPGRTWAFQRPQNAPLPAVKHPEWVRNPIDRFLLARLEAQGLHPAPPADKRTLLRRVTFDLIGLPPTPAEVEAFVADDSPEALAKVVERLLASPQYGERWARHWLDLVRYTDDFDESWRYRDWVVDAFNHDLPYNEFILIQVAGDLLPAPTPGTVNADGIVATTLLAIGPWSGIDRKKRLTDIVDDQIDMIGRDFLGLTLACARCHNHKFDPIPQADYYGLAGIFFSSHILSDESYISHKAPVLRIPLVPAALVAKHRQHQQRIGEEEHKVQLAVDQAYANFARTLLPQTGRYLTACWDFQHRPADQAKLSAEEFAQRQGLQGFALTAWLAYLDGARLGAYQLLTMPVRDYDGEPGVQVWRTRAERPWWAVNSTDHDVPIETWKLPPRSVAINPGVEGGVVGWKSPITGTVQVHGRLSDADPYDGVGVTWVLDHVAGGVRHELASGTLANGGSMRLADGKTPERLAAVPVQAGDEIDLHIRLTESDAHYDITPVELTIQTVDGRAQWDLAHDVVSNFLEGNPHRDGCGHAAVWYFYDGAGSNRFQRLPAAEALVDRWKEAVSKIAADKPDRGVLEKAAQQFQQAVAAAGPESPLVHDLTGPRSPFHVASRDDARYLPSTAREALAKQEVALNALKESLPAVPCANGIQEGGIRYSLYPGIQDAPIHIRGSYERLGPRVPRHFPEALAGPRQPPIGSGSGRLELGRWLGSASNPLTARVLVNRVWQHHFGEGIVRTPSNFGAKGERPSHPELLDWLALRFMESGWSIKALHRLILLSAAYQQTSRPSPEALRADPDNRLFSRLNRRRLEAEAIRDSVLAVAGRLDLRPGGPPEQDAASPRRMLYLVIKRTDRSGIGPLFDGANAAMHVDRRSASTVAPQALFLMNSPWVTEAVQRLVERPEIAGESDEVKRIAALYRLLYGREPTAGEVRLGRDFVAALEKEKNTAPLGPWPTYTQALLLANEFLFVD